MSKRNVISKLVAATRPSRALDASIARALGFKHVRKSKERASYWLSLEGKEVDVPRYTFSLDAAYHLAISQETKGGVTWDEKTGAAKIGRGSSYVGATAPIALCIATLHAMIDSKDARASTALADSDKADLR